ncbi:MAG: iron-sulfur cluster assembly scaffold protein, partial [Candidatus Scalindua sp.]|nr:iron-sulfur cluster assembly scaffold protein [Candidatus Scalindua sp.]
MNGPYSEKVMDHFMEPRNMGDIKDADAVGTVGNPACGDVMRLYLKVEGDKIVEAKFKTFGCGAAIATSSM